MSAKSLAPLEVRVLVALAAPGGYEVQQAIERWGSHGATTLRSLARKGLVEEGVDGRFRRTSKGDAMSPTRRALAEAGPGGSRVRAYPARGLKGVILEAIEGATAKAPMVVREIAFHHYGHANGASNFYEAAKALAAEGAAHLVKVDVGIKGWPVLAIYPAEDLA